MIKKLIKTQTYNQYVDLYPLTQSIYSVIIHVHVHVDYNVLLLLYINSSRQKLYGGKAGRWGRTLEMPVGVGGRGECARAMSVYQSVCKCNLKHHQTITVSMYKIFVPIRLCYRCNIRKGI